MFYVHIRDGSHWKICMANIWFIWYFISDLKNIVKQITNEKGYDAEAAVSPMVIKLSLHQLKWWLELYALILMD